MLYWLGMLTISDLSTILMAVGYLTYAIINSSGPLNLFDGLRRIPRLGDLFNCSICLSFWVAVMMLGLHLYNPLFVLPFAFAGGYLIIRALWSVIVTPLWLYWDAKRLENARDLYGMIITNDILLEDDARGVFENYLRLDDDLDSIFEDIAS